MSIPEDAAWRHCASAYAEPVTEDEQNHAEALVAIVDRYNPHFNIEYRLGIGDHDRIHHVFRWSRLPIEQVFRDGFRTTNDHNTPTNIYYNLEHYVHQAGRPLDQANRRESFAFISTTVSTSWQPTVDRDTDVVYRYEIYAPGGIYVTETLGDGYQFPTQDEVAFVGAIAPEYIRSAQRFRPNRVAGNSRYPPRLERADRVLVINGNFRPHPPMLITIQNPVCVYVDTEGGRRRNVALNQEIYYAPQGARRGKRQVSTATIPNTVRWYATGVANTESYITAAFRSSYSSDEAYIFMKNVYVLVNYAPGTTGDWIMNGPLPIYEGYPSLDGTVFAEWGIDCAFRSHYGSEAFIFCGNRCARIDYAPHTTDDKILKGPVTIARMFPFFEGTVFENGIDAAFEATAKYEAYLFKGNRYALINYRTGSAKLIAIRRLTQGFPSLRGTIFETGIDAAFASYRTDEAYLFKGDSYALINFKPASTDDYLLGGVKKILPNWPSLRSVLPRNNQGIDMHDQPSATHPPPYNLPTSKYHPSTHTYIYICVL